MFPTTGLRQRLIDAFRSASSREEARKQFIVGFGSGAPREYGAADWTSKGTASGGGSGGGPGTSSFYGIMRHPSTEAFLGPNWDHDDDATERALLAEFRDATETHTKQIDDHLASELSHDGTMPLSGVKKVMANLVAVLKHPRKMVQSFNGKLVDQDTRDLVGQFSTRLSETRATCADILQWVSREKSNLQYITDAIWEANRQLGGKNMDKIRDLLERFTSAENELHAELDHKLRNLIRTFDKQILDLQARHDKLKNEKGVVRRCLTIAKGLFVCFTVASLICTVLIAVLVCPPIALVSIGIGVVCNASEPLLNLANKYKDRLNTNFQVASAGLRGSKTGLKDIKAIHDKIRDIKADIDALRQNSNKYTLNRDTSSLLTHVGEMGHLHKCLERDLDSLRDEVAKCTSQLEVCKQIVDEKMLEGIAKGQQSSRARTYMLPLKA